MTMDEWTEACESANPAEQKDLIGASPGAVGVALGISRQAVHQAIQRGDLDAIRIEDNGKLRAIMITPSSYQRYVQYREMKSVIDAT